MLLILPRVDVIARYMLWPIVFLSVSLSFCLSICETPGVVQRLIVWSREQSHTIYPRESSTLTPKMLVQVEWGHTQRRRQIQWGR